MTDPTHARIKSVAIWFYIIAAFQAFSAYTLWSAGKANAEIAAGAAVLAGFDIIIGLLFVVFGYYAAQKRPWAFVAGLVLYALRAVLQFFEFFNPISLIIRAFLLFRIYQGLQACLAVQRGEAAMRSMAVQRRLEMPQSAAAAVPAAWAPSAARTPSAGAVPPTPAAPPPAWRPTRDAAPPQSQAESESGGYNA
jgi:hypothetical protein